MSDIFQEIHEFEESRRVALRAVGDGHARLSVDGICEMTGFEREIVGESLREMAIAGELEVVFVVSSPHSHAPVMTVSRVEDIPYSQLLSDQDGAQFMVSPADVDVVYEASLELRLLSERLAAAA
ncbi:hypothetical protein [Miltoncostaea oceani]|uniref:hypothetical protein n=1 Tax=Miltoncostaea oceani TaxID=2843216 RepID=UPI001C3E4740|nr:hypothetical protein [Miltoncostaea oceani]